MAKYRKKPVVIEASQFDIKKPYAHPGVHGSSSSAFYVTTIHGQAAYLADGDWILPEPKEGHFYPCKPDIFAATYEAVGEPTAAADFDWPPRASAVDLPDGERRRGSTGQMFEAKGGQWIWLNEGGYSPGGLRDDDAIPKDI